MIEILEHTADIGFRVTSDTLPELFEEAARALFTLIAVQFIADENELEKTLTIPISSNLEDLLFDWLNELLYLFETRRLFFHKVDIAWGTTELTAIMKGEPYCEKRYLPQHEVKAITYHDLSVRQLPTGWQATVIVDI